MRNYGYKKKNQKALLLFFLDAQKNKTEKKIKNNASVTCTSCNFEGRRTVKHAQKKNRVVLQWMYVYVVPTKKKIYTYIYKKYRPNDTIVTWGLLYLHFEIVHVLPTRHFMAVNFYNVHIGFRCPSHVIRSRNYRSLLKKKIRTFISFFFVDRFSVL